MLRGSGTEPVLRIYAEAKSDAAARELIAAGVRITKRV
jgi:phosphomannomutase